MDKNKQIGLFIQQNSVYCSEIIDGACRQSFSLSLNVERENKTPGQHPKSRMESIQAGNMLHEAFTTHNISAKSVNLSLPLSDIIFRTFTIPWVPSKDIASLVKFEAGKYMPFNIDELSYTYHPIIVTEKGTKQIRIVFSAIKLKTIEKYKTFVESAGLKANLIEPEPFSLLRILKAGSFIPENETVAIAVFDNTLSKIIVVDNAMPFFVREFPLPKNASSDSIYTEKFTSEIRVSLDYFNRQNNHIKISKIFVVSPFARKDLSIAIESEIGLQAINIDFKSLSDQKIEKTPFLYAIGVGLNQDIDLPIQANLNDEMPTQRVKKQNNLSETLNKKALILTGSICLIFLITISTLGFSGFKKEETKYKSFMGNLGEYFERNIEDIQTENTSLSEKLKFYSQLNFNQKISGFLALIGSELPAGVWLEKINIPYPQISQNIATTEIAFDKPKSIDFSGYAYHQDSQEQIALINTFFKNINSQELFSKNFESIEIQSLKSETKDEYAITHFEITCQ